MKRQIQHALLNPVSMALVGLLTGFLVKMMDVYCYAQHFGCLSAIYSPKREFGWLVIGMAISLYSRNTKYAMINIFLFCLRMLVTYYITAEVTNSVYGWSFIKVWAVFACFSPLMAYLARLTMKPGLLAFVLKLGVFVGYLGLNLLLGYFLHYYDLPFLLILVYLLFLKKWTIQDDMSQKGEKTQKGSMRIDLMLPYDDA